MHIVYLSPGFPSQNKRTPGCFRHSLLWLSLLQELLIFTPLVKAFTVLYRYSAHTMISNLLLFTKVCVYFTGYNRRNIPHTTRFKIFQFD